MIKEFTAATILVILLVILANPAHIAMPSMAHVAVATALLVVFGFFASIVLRESAHDEREGTHRMHAGRAAFLAGSLALIVGIIYQSLMHMLDIWLPIVLVIMILVKIGTHFYTDRYR